MPNGLKIRLVKEADASYLLDIYRPIVLETATSFESVPPDLATFEERILTYSSAAPWLVAELEGKPVGYAYATSHRSRGSYRWNQETTVYMDSNYRKQGIARLLYSKLFELLTAQGYTKALAVITLPNDPSIGFHKSMGFTHIGEMEKIGFKFNRWHTTSWWHKELQSEHFIPGEIKSVAAVLNLLD